MQGREGSAHDGTDTLNEEVLHAVSAVMCIPVIVHDGVDPMCDGEDGTVSKFCADGLLNEVIGLEVHGSSGLVQDQDLGLAEQSSGQAHQLTLANTVSVCVWGGGGGGGACEV